MLLHRRQPGYRETSNADKERERRLEGVIRGETRKKVTGFLYSMYMAALATMMIPKVNEAQEYGHMSECSENEHPWRNGTVHQQQSLRLARPVPSTTVG